LLRRIIFVRSLLPVKSSGSKDIQGETGRELGLAPLEV
jgi:hypothetical protein